MAKKQKSGLYRSKVKIGVDASGKDILKYISGKTKRELEEQRQLVIAKYIDYTALADDRLFGEYAVEWFAARKAPKISVSSRESYRTALNKHILPEFGYRKLRSISPLELQQFVNRFAGASQTKITYIISALKGVFQSACIDRLVLRSPMEYVDKPQATAAAEKHTLTPTERARIEEVCRTHPHGCYLASMYYLGVRPGEARGLRWGDFDWSRRRVHVQRDIDYKSHGEAGKLKTAGSDRWVPVPDPLYRLLYPHRSEDDDYLFAGERSGLAFAKTTAERVWISLMQACGMTAPRQPGESKYRASDIRSQLRPLITPHTLRHNYITMCWESGVDVYTAMRYVGHSSINTLVGVYMHLTEEMMATGQSQLNAVFAADPEQRIHLLHHSKDTMLPISSDMSFKLIRSLSNH